MFTKTAAFYDALYHFVDYRSAARQLQRLVKEQVPGATSLLDVGCGTGRHLEHFSEWSEVEGLDLDGQLLEVARQRCPEVPLHQASMVDFRLPRRFDVITCLFSAIGYTESLDNMREAIANMARHLAPGGLLIVEPWFDPDRFWTDTITSNHYEDSKLKICWMYTSKREDNVSVLDIHYLVGTSEGVEHMTEQHRMGLFSRQDHLDAFGSAGLRAEFDPVGPFRRGLYVGQASESLSA